MATWPVYPFHTGRTGCYGCVRNTPKDGGCGIGSYPCTHYGMDLVSKVGDRTVVAPEGGLVVAVSGSTPPYTGYGPAVVELLGNSGRYHLLAHLELGTVGVAKGARVAEGQVIGKYDPAYNHTHYEVRRELLGPSKTNTIDPSAWMASQSLVLKLALVTFVAWGTLKLIR